MSLCSVTEYCGDTAERIEMPLGTEVDVGPVTKNKKGFLDPPREGGNPQNFIISAITSLQFEPLHPFHLQEISQPTLASAIRLTPQSPISTHAVSYRRTSGVLVYNVTLPF